VSERLRELREVLIEARKSVDYDIASPRAFDHLVTHIIALIAELESIESRRPFDWGNFPVSGERGGGMNCSVCGNDDDTRFGVCFDCASAAERKAAKRSVIGHLWQGVIRLLRGDRWGAVTCFKWARERLTATGDYAPGGTFDAEYPGWRND
jgi:hypothetical protein